eukprot:GHVQ01026653.1.p1 GENE.GHVQ01026653.1~~GHVQ01026653.1.p1  ORF type:complete len:1157 (-),score=119.47 GHVQ01026653.1:1814-5284(-)
MGWDATKDFAGKGSLVYLRRQLVAWSDCVKLRYGRCPSDNEFLWNWMTKYCRDAAKVFHGVRLDNCHSTPIHVAKHMLQACRRERSNIWVYAELFTGEQLQDLYFERELGISALIREAMQTHSTLDLANHVTKYCEAPTVGALSEQISSSTDAKRPLKPTMCPALFYDCTHDNETPNQKRTPADALSTAAIVCASTCAVGSTRGYDELVPLNLNVVSECRLYQDYQNHGTPHVEVDASLDAGNCVKKPVSVYWYKEATTVHLRGDWDDWAEDVICERQRDGTHLGIVSNFSNSEHNEYQFKFIVDGKWCHDQDQPCVRDGSGHLNNVLSCNGRKPKNSKAWQPGEVLPGMMEVRRVLNGLHYEMNVEGFTEVTVVCPTDDITVIHRHKPSTHASVHFIVRSAFTWDKIHHASHHATDVVVPGKVHKCLLAAHLYVPACSNFVDDVVKINGLPCHLHLHESAAPMANLESYDEDTQTTTIHMHNFPPASVLVFKTYGCSSTKQAIESLIRDELPKACSSVDLTTATKLLYSCENEERDLYQRGSYDVPGHGALQYCGIVGVTGLFDSIRASPSSLSHALCDNIRQGDWLLQYHCNRLKEFPRVHEWLTRVTEYLSKPPGATSEPSTTENTPSSQYRLIEEPSSLPILNWLKPFYVDYIFRSMYRAVQRVCLSKMDKFISTSRDPLVQQLAMATLQFYSYVPSGSIEFNTTKPSLCAGLPHFSTGYMRNWGRDTFIALKGILLVTRRFEEAKGELMGYASVVRHGLIPNLLDGANTPRYNARDATWFWTQAVQDYCLLAPEGLNFLLTPVVLKFPPASEDPTVCNIADLIHHILSKHAKGIEFTEWNAGKKIDEHMEQEGFNVKVTLDPSNGLISGGNEFNCGTWMDKMGSSTKAGNKGIPATPRDGAAVELVALLKSTLRFVSKLPENVFPYSSVVTSSGEELTYTEWNSLIAASFENLFYVPQNDDDCEYCVDKKLVNRKGIYKDSYRATHPWCDYQLRPNVCVAMAVAPELFKQEHATKCLEMIESCLWSRRQLGLKTLDPSDFNYRGIYDNAHDGDDKHVAHGWNYHQGPEWVWPVGYFLESKLKFSEDDESVAKQHCLQHLASHRRFIQSSTWKSLPELTNKDGCDCFFSCPAQAWSVATILAFLYEAAKKIA